MAGASLVMPLAGLGLTFGTYENSSIPTRRFPCAQFTHILASAS